MSGIHPDVVTEVQVNDLDESIAINRQFDCTAREMPDDFTVSAYTRNRIQTPRAVPPELSGIDRLDIHFASGRVR